MKDEERFARWWQFLYALIRPFLIRRFQFEYESCSVGGPCLIVSNHVSNWDPLLLALSFRDKPIHFVASEHIFRKGLLSRLLESVLQPIARKKASSGADTVKACIRTLRDGGTVCLFAEGDACWDGVSHEAFPATGKLARASGATLITYRLEGVYLAFPRWGTSRRKGRTKGTVVGVYPPQELKSMRGEEITRLINRDIYVNIWERQKGNPVEYRSSKGAQAIEQGFYLCPKCRAVGTVRGEGNTVSCRCGYRAEFTPRGFLVPPDPFETLEEWDRWQSGQMRDMSCSGEEKLFSDGSMSLTRVDQHHAESRLARGELSQYGDRLEICGHTFPVDQIRDMAMVKANVLLFTLDDSYYEIRSEQRACLRKYLAFWQNRKERKSSAGKPAETAGKI